MEAVGGMAPAPVQPKQYPPRGAQEPRPQHEQAAEPVLVLVAEAEAEGLVALVRELGLAPAPALVEEAGVVGVAPQPQVQERVEVVVGLVRVQARALATCAW